MKLGLLLVFLASALSSASAKDGHGNSKDSPVIPAARTTPKTYYSYSYKNPATSLKRGTANVADYARKGAATIDSYKSSSKYPQISGKSWSASSTVSSAQNSATSKINSLKSKTLNAATKAALQSALRP